MSIPSGPSRRRENLKRKQRGDCCVVSVQTAKHRVSELMHLNSVAVEVGYVKNQLERQNNQ